MNLAFPSDLPAMPGIADLCIVGILFRKSNQLRKTS